MKKITNGYYDYYCYFIIMKIIELYEIMIFVCVSITIPTLTIQRRRVLRGLRGGENHIKCHIVLLCNNFINDKANSRFTVICREKYIYPALCSGENIFQIDLFKLTRARNVH